MSLDIEVFINNVSIKLYKSLITDTLVVARQKLNIGNSEDYTFLIDGKEIEYNEEKKFTMKEFQNTNKNVY